MNYTPELVAALGDGLRPRPRPTFPDWADEHLWLKRGGELRRWQTSLTPYLRQPMLDASVDSPVEEIVLMKPSQWGGSECFAVGFPCYQADVAPCDILLIQPDLDAAARFSQLRIDTVIENSPRLRAIFREKKSRDAGNTQHLKTFDGGSWAILGSNSPAGVSSLPATVGVFDEVDRSALSVGAGWRAEGDLYLMLKARTVTFRDTFPRRKLIRISSPGETSTSRIEPAWLSSDRRRYHVPCSECGARIVFSFKRLWWSRGGDPRTARYRCQICDKLLDERDKPEMLALGEWVAEFPDREVHGYKGTGLDSPFLRWGEMAAERERVKGNPHELRVYVNTVEGETYDTHAEAKVDVAKLKLLACEVEFVDGQPVIPTGVGILTSGADMQPNRLEASLKGWGRGEECWWIDHVIFPGDVTTRQPWNDLDTYWLSTWHNTSGRAFRIAAACVDTGGETPIPAYDYVRGKAVRRIWAIKGKGGPVRPWPRKPKRTNQGNVDLYSVGVDAFKAQLYARLKASIEQVERGEPAGGPGFIHIAAHLCEDIERADGSREPSEYLQQLVAEVPKTVQTHVGLAVRWELPTHTRNETLDCDVYAQAALMGWKALRKRLDATVTDAPAQVPETTETKIDNSARSPNLESVAAPPKATPTTPRPTPPRPSVRDLTKRRKKAADYM